MTAVKLAFSPCPNDTFVFGAMVHGLVNSEGLRFDYRMEDVETLNTMALSGRGEVVKVSYHAYLYLSEKYALLDSGSALGFGNGPLLISKKPCSPDDLQAMTVAIPCKYTTANLLLKLALPGVRMKRIMVFSRIEDAILEGEADAGVIIHENRFTFEKKGLVKIMDLGEYWEQQTGLPVPFGGIVAKKSLGYETIGKLNRVLHRSVEFAMQNPGSVMEFVRCNAREMDEEVMMKHIRLYVNQHTLDLGPEGKKAVHELIRRSGAVRDIP